jgi:hypothetical protein
VESLYRINVVNGKPAASGELLLQKLYEYGYDIDFKTTGSLKDKDLSVIMTGKLNDNTKTVTKDVKWAAQMGLMGRDNWQRMPETMLTWRCVSEFARFYAPQAVSGVYITEEMMESTSSVPVIEVKNIEEGKPEEKPKDNNNEEPKGK